MDEVKISQGDHRMGLLVEPRTSRFAFQCLDFRAGSFFETVEQTKHKTGRFGTDEVFGLVEGGERGIGVGGKDDVVKPGDGHLRRYLYSCCLHGM